MPERIVHANKRNVHPELLENQQFLRYYERWQKEPLSIAFMPVSEYLLKYDLKDEALKVCKEGLKNNPSLVSARILLAKIFIQTGMLDEATEELKHVLMVVPNQPAAVELLAKIEEKRLNADEEKVSVSKVSPWCTVTMAKLHAKQGNKSEAARIYRNILEKEPANEIAKKALTELEANI